MIARTLAEKLGDTEIISIPRVGGKLPPISAGRIGLVFPTYYAGLPRIVERFIARLPPVEGKYIFAVTSGRDADSPLGVLTRAARLLRRRGLELSAGFYLRMVSNFTPMFDAPPREEQERRFAEAESRLGEIAEIIAAGQKHIEKNSRLKNWLFSTVIHSFFAARIPGADKKFRIDEKCTGCGTCFRVCPVENIGLRDGKPFWRHHCELCLGCLHWCPQGAIQYGKKTAGRTRYRNPGAKVENFIYR